MPASSAEKMVVLEPRSFVLPDGRLDLQRLLRELLAFWSEHGEVLAGSMAYHEVAPQIVLMAYLSSMGPSAGRSGTAPYRSWRDGLRQANE